MMIDLTQKHIEVIRQQWDSDLYPCNAEFYSLCDMALRTAQLERELAARAAAAVEEAAKACEDAAKNVKQSYGSTYESIAKNECAEIIRAIATAPAGFVCVPVELSDEHCKDIAVLAHVCPEHDKANCPEAFFVAIRNYHRAMLAARPK